MLSICFSPTFTWAQKGIQENHQVLAPSNSNSCVFASDKATFLYHSTAHPVENAPHLGWQVDWALAVGNRTIARGTINAVSPTLSDIPQYLIEIPLPVLKDSVVLPVELQTNWTAGTQTYQHKRLLHLFSRDPFSSQQKFLKDSQIKLFDPKGGTAELLDKNEISHARLLNFSAIDLVAEGIILVGEDVSFREQRELPHSLFQAAQRGVSVLCLAPSEGDFPLSEQHARRITLERGEVIRSYDKRFDEIATIRPLSLQARKGGMVISTVQENGPWSWVSMEFHAKDPGKQAGKIVICGLGIIGHWESSPVPRYLFARLLEDFTNRPTPLEERKNASLSQ